MNDWAARLRDLELEKRDLKKRIAELEAELANLDREQRTKEADRLRQESRCHAPEEDQWYV